MQEIQFRSVSESLYLLNVRLFSSSQITSPSKN